jgi:hypothetical protein
MTLAEFDPTNLFIVSVGSPAGVVTNLFDPECPVHLDEACSFLPEHVMGEIDKQGFWRWNGIGNPTDWQGNTILRIDAWKE